MSNRFEEWAEQEILRLRTEADALERALQNYHSLQGRSPTVPKKPAMQGGRPRAVARTKGRRKGSKTQAIMQFIRKTGSGGAVLKDVYGLVAERGLDMQKSSVRSVLYLEKKKGRLYQREGRYFFGGNGLERDDSSPSIAAGVA